MRWQLRERTQRNVGAGEEARCADHEHEEGDGKGSGRGTCRPKLRPKYLNRNEYDALGSATAPNPPITRPKLLPADRKGGASGARHAYA